MWMRQRYGALFDSGRGFNPPLPVLKAQGAVLAFFTKSPLRAYKIAILFRR
jgi:hypothetical protein